MKSNALTKLGERYGLGGDQLTQLSAILLELRSDNQAPTAVTDAAEALDIHLADSLAALEIEVVGEARRIADIGSGAGFPGIALAVALPSAEVNLVESQRRKCEFLGRVCLAAAVENARVVPARAEGWGDGSSHHDLVVARALAPQPVVLEYAAPLLKIGGTLVDWRGKRAPGEEDLAENAGKVLGLRRTEVRRAVPFEGARDHHLHVFVKEQETPPRFPRRTGVARKRPLGHRTAR